MTERDAPGCERLPPGVERLMDIFGCRDLLMELCATSSHNYDHSWRAMARIGKFMDVANMAKDDDTPLANNDIAAIKFAALMHDVGKVTMPKLVNSDRLKGEFNDEELRELGSHPFVGWVLLEDSLFVNGKAEEITAEEYQVIKFIIENHHVRYEDLDATGVSKWLIDATKLLQIIDRDDALQDFDRPYHRGLPYSAPHSASKIRAELRGSVFGLSPDAVLELSR